MFVSVMIGATAAVFGVGQTPVVAPVVVAPIQAPVPEQCGTQAELGIIVQGGKAPESGIIVQGGKTPETGIIVQGGKTAATGIIVQGGLERDGLVTRTVTPTIPPRVDYELTELGISLREPVKALGEWAIEHIGCIRAAQARFDAERDGA